MVPPAPFGEEGFGMEEWRARLENGERDAAWNAFIRKYRGFILSVIRRIQAEPQDVDDAFAEVCRALSENDLDRLTKYSPDDARAARFTTWLATVVHRLVIDWIRRENGRSRLKVPDELAGLQRDIFTHVFVEQRTHSESYELLRSGEDDLSFRRFLQDLAETYRIVERARPGGVMRYLGAPPLVEAVPPAGQISLETTEARFHLGRVLEALTADERLAIQLFVVEGMRAEDVARIIGWPNAKAVYNRVYRTLAALRTALERNGLGADDL